MLYLYISEITINLYVILLVLNVILYMLVTCYTAVYNICVY